jgi:hypothetical protein
MKLDESVDFGFQLSSQASKGRGALAEFSISSGSATGPLPLEEFFGFLLTHCFYLFVSRSMAINLDYRK